MWIYGRVELMEQLVGRRAHRITPGGVWVELVRGGAALLLLMRAHDVVPRVAGLIGVVEAEADHSFAAMLLARHPQWGVAVASAWST